jgi:major membrane immunogen (membrane-anchored lipoprotein)
VEVTNYVLVEFQKQGSVYKVTKVQVRGEWQNFSVPKNKSWDEIGTKGFAFFRIDDGKVVDARVIYPK